MIFYSTKYANASWGENAMYMKEAVVNNQDGLHKRTDTIFIPKANKFKSSI